MFNDIELEYNGKVKTIKANEIMPLIGKVEHIIPLSELLGGGAPPMATISMAYGAMLRYAGFAVTDAAVYADMFNGSKAAQTAAEAATNLMVLMIPPGVLNQKPSEDEDSAKKKDEALSESATS
jgi:hypothetical protein